MRTADIAFYALALFILGNGLLVIRSRNIVHSAYYMVFCFLGVAGIYALLGAKFLALAQILIYGGAVAVLIIFAIMTVLNPHSETTNPSHGRRLGAAFAVGLLTVVSLMAIFRGITTTARGRAPAGDISSLADMLMGSYAVPLEAAALLLLVALVGAIILVKGAEKR